MTDTVLTPAMARDWGKVLDEDWEERHGITVHEYVAARWPRPLLVNADRNRKKKAQQ